MRRWSSDQKMAAATYEPRWQPFLASSFGLRRRATSSVSRAATRKRRDFPYDRLKRGNVCQTTTTSSWVVVKTARVYAHTRAHSPLDEPIRNFASHSQWKKAVSCDVHRFESPSRYHLSSSLAGYTFVIIWLAKSVVFFFSVISFVWKFWNMNFPQSTWVMTSGPLHSTVAFVSRCFAVLFHLLE